MPKKRPVYPPEYRQRLVELVRAGRSAESLAREFEPSAHTIRTWVKQADLDEGRRDDGLTTAEREELARLRRQVRELKMEREILKKRPWASRHTHEAMKAARLTPWPRSDRGRRLSGALSPEKNGPGCCVAPRIVATAVVVSTPGKLF